MMFCGFFIFSFSLCYSNYLSKARVASPVETVPVIPDKELKAPPTEWAIKDLVPSAIPNPNSAGPFTKPCAGLSFKSLMPVEMFLKRLIGLPIIFKLPKTLYSWAVKSLLYLEINSLVIVSTVSMQSVISIPFITIGAPSMLETTTPIALRRVESS